MEGREVCGVGGGGELGAGFILSDLEPGCTVQ